MKKGIWILIIIFNILVQGVSENSPSKTEYYEENNNYIISPNNHNNLVYTYSLENQLIRKEYDEKKRLIKKIVWNIIDESKNHEIIYEYDEDSMFPKYSESTYYFTELKITNKTYYWKDGSGNKKRICLFHNDILNLEQYYEYDDENRISTYSEKKYEEEQLKYETKVLYEYVSFESETFINEYHFSNDVENSLVNFKTYEKVYTSKTEYYENTFFEGDIRIYTEYKNDVKITEITYIDHEEIKIRK